MFGSTAVAVSLRSGFEKMISHLLDPLVILLPSNPHRNRLFHPSRSHNNSYKPSVRLGILTLLLLGLMKVFGRAMCEVLLGNPSLIQRLFEEEIRCHEAVWVPFWIQSF